MPIPTANGLPVATPYAGPTITKAPLSHWWGRASLIRLGTSPGGAAVWAVAVSSVLILSFCKRWERKRGSPVHTLKARESHRLTAARTCKVRPRLVRALREGAHQRQLPGHRIELHTGHEGG